MLISEIAKIIIDKKEPVSIRRKSFDPGEYLFVEDEYPNFYSNWAGHLIEWYPSLDDLIADDWEFIKD